MPRGFQFTAAHALARGCGERNGGAAAATGLGIFQHDCGFLRAPPSFARVTVRTRAQLPAQSVCRPGRARRRRGPRRALSNDVLGDAAVDDMRQACIGHGRPSESRSVPRSEATAVISRAAARPLRSSTSLSAPIGPRACGNGGSFASVSRTARSRPGCRLLGIEVPTALPRTIPQRAADRPMRSARTQAGRRSPTAFCQPALK